MTGPKARITDSISCGDVLIENGSPNVYCNFQPVVEQMKTLTQGHTCNCQTFISQGSPSVFANFIRQCSLGDPIQPHGCGILHPGTISSGSPNVFIGQESLLHGNPLIASNILNDASLADPHVVPGVDYYTAAVMLNDDPGTDIGIATVPITTISNPYAVQVSTSIGVNPNSPPPIPVQTNSTPPQPNSPITSSCSDIFSMSPPYRNSLQLSPNFTLGMVSTQTVVTRYNVNDVTVQDGFTTAQLVCNLRQLCLNILENFIVKIHPNPQLNSGFRIGTGSQHNRGQAIDIQIAGFSKMDYWNLAPLVRDTLAYDEFIFENSFDTGLAWFHLSYNPSGNRHIVVSRTKPGVYSPGLVLV